MNKKEFLIKYTSIEREYAVKAEKNKKIKNLLYQMDIDNDVYTVNEIAEISDYLMLNSIIIRQPVFASIIYPPLDQGVVSGDINAVKALIRLSSYMHNHQKYTKHYKYSVSGLVDAGLKISPYDKELLGWYEKNTRDYLLYTLHELPSGVLYGVDGASVEECDELIFLVAEYESACEKLSVEYKEMIAKCRFYYLAYKKYLLNTNLYTSFSNYLETIE